MLFWLFTAACLAAPAQPEARDSAVVLSAAVVEQLRLPFAPASVASDEWEGEVRLEVGAEGKRARAAVKAAHSKLCPRLELRGTTLVLGCLKGPVVGHLALKGGLPVLELAQLRGLPWHESGVLLFHYSPERFGLGEACPGSSPAGKGECLLEDGQYAQAKEALQAALKSVDAPFAHLRLGDLALAVDQDPVEALRHYQAAGLRGAPGRLAVAHSCEVTGCSGRSPAYNATAIAEPARSELELRGARALAFEGEVADAAGTLATRVAEADRPDVCAQWPRTCDGMVRQALSSADPEIQAQGLAAFMRLRASAAAAPGPELSRRAADAAANLGASRFAANLMASVTPTIPKGELEAHLKRTAALYDSTGDKVRGDVIREYALVRLGKGRGRSPPLRPAAEPVDATLPFKELQARAAHDLDVAGAFGVISRARAATAPTRP